MSTADDFDGRALRPGAFYWVRITLDPDVDDVEAWMNSEQPARYDGGGRWHFLGVADASSWPVSWVGGEIQDGETRALDMADRVLSLARIYDKPGTKLDGEFVANEIRLAVANARGADA